MILKNQQYFKEDYSI